MLSKFHKNIILFFCVLLILISIIFYRNFLYLISNTSFPKYINPCPDHWNKSIDETDNHLCIASHLNIGKNNNQSINLSKKTIIDGKDKNELTQNNSKYHLDPNFDFKNVYNKNNYCALYEYSKNNKLHWSGITNANYTKYC